MHPNIVSVYSISLRPSGLPLPKPAAADSSGGLLLLREDGTAVVGGSELLAKGGAPLPSTASLELMPWEMQLVMEFCDQVCLKGGGGVREGGGGAGKAAWM
jgi:hypothetical protein